MSESRILRWKVPVDGRVHALPLSGPVVHVAARFPDAVEVWARDDGVELPRYFTVAGTGHPFPAEYAVVGTALAPLNLVWHLLEVPPHQEEPT